MRAFAECAHPVPQSSFRSTLRPHANAGQTLSGTKGGQEKESGFFLKKPPTQEMHSFVFLLQFREELLKSIFSIVSCDTVETVRLAGNAIVFRLDI